MSTGQIVSDVWYMDGGTFRDHYQRVTQGGATKLQRCRQYMIRTSMIGFGLISWMPQNRQSRTSFQMRTGPQSMLGFTWTGKKFVCSDDDVDIVSYETGEFVRRQIWEHYTKWEDVPDSEFDSVGAGGG